VSLHANYESNLAEAQKFEDFASNKLHSIGISIGVFRSKHFQIMYGESRAGFEIKYDTKRIGTGNLFIETEERPSIKHNFKPSGPFHSDNSWMYVIGDYHKIWIFSCNELRRLAREYKFKQTPTAKGFLLPVTDADVIAAKIINC